MKSTTEADRHSDISILIYSLDFRHTRGLRKIKASRTEAQQKNSISEQYITIFDA